MINLSEYTDFKLSHQATEFVYYDAIYLKGRVPVTIKFFPVQGISSQNLENVYRESSQLKKVQSKRLAQFFECRQLSINGQDGLGTIYKKCGGVSLTEYLEKSYLRGFI